jgi:hypothetical protein
MEPRARAKALLNDAQRVLAEGTPEELKDLVRCFVHRVEIDPANKRGRLLYYASSEIL